MKMNIYIYIYIYIYISNVQICSQFYFTGRIFYDKFRHDNEKQEWIVRKWGSKIGFENNYQRGEYLSGDLEHYDGVCLCGMWWLWVKGTPSFWRIKLWKDEEERK